jgi:spoIIIJ-associated protein
MTDFETIELVTAAITDVLTRMGVEADVEFEDSITKGPVFNINTRDSYLLIGRQGAHLHALQTIVQALVNKKLRGRAPFYFTIDVDDYKRKREWFLRETAKQAVEQMKRTGRPITLEPMPNYERRLIHAYLQEHSPEVFTESVGREPNRKIVIRLKREQKREDN